MHPREDRYRGDVKRLDIGIPSNGKRGRYLEYLWENHEPSRSTARMTVSVITGDCLTVLGGMSARSVECCVTSPPYDDMRAYGGYSWNFKGVVHELYRVMCDGGVICWNVGDQVVEGSETLTSVRQAIYFKDHAGFRVHDTMIYEKTATVFPERVRYNQVFEYVFILSKGAPRCFNQIRDKPNTWAGQERFGNGTARRADGSMQPIKSSAYAEFGARGNVWRGKTAAQEEVCQPSEHPARMPKWLASDLIASWSNPGDTILDPFAGSGTTGLAADRLQRDAILVEINESYADMARERIAADSPLFAEVTA